MTFSPLTAYSVGTEKYSSRYGTPVSRLIVHHTAGGTNDGNVALLSTGARDVSANYCLLTTAELVGIVPEEYRAWTSGSPAADNPSITVETVNTSGEPDWLVSDAQIERLAQLAADLCVRYGWGSLDRNRVIGHRQVAQTACPGPYLYPLLDWIVERGNMILAGEGPTIPNDEDEDDMNTYFQPTNDSDPITDVDPITGKPVGKPYSRIWAGERKIGGMTFSPVWERSGDGSARRLFKAELAGIQDAYALTGRVFPLVTDINGNGVEQIVYGKRY